jgi:hypothetical protein
MRWERIRYWQWLVIAVVVGLSVGLWRRADAEQAVAGLGESLNGQSQFEEALLQDVRGRRQFDTISVTSELLPDPIGKGRFVHVVSGMYYDGRPDGAEPAWRPAFFVASVPYRPQLDLSRLGAAGEQIRRELAGIGDPTVLDFLAILHRTGGVDYQYAWWRGSAYAIWFWLLGCIVVIGLAFPRVINLKVYGTFSRPPVERRPKLAPVALPDRPATSLRASAALADRPAPAQAPSDVEPATATAVPVLQGGPLEPLAEEAAESKEFGADKDDFYPTERHVRH